MANIYRKLDMATSQSKLTSFKNALLDKYGEEKLTFHYESSTDLIFSCPQISDKVIKFNFSPLSAYYGDEYTSGANISNSKQFLNCYNGPQVIHVVFGDNFIFTVTFISGSNCTNGIIGKTKGGKNICYGAVTSGTGSVKGNNCMYDIDSGRSVFPQSFSRPMCSRENVPYVTPIIFVYSDTLVPMMLSDGGLDTIEELYMSTYQGLLVRENALFSNVNVYSATYTDIHTTSSIMAEF